VVSGGTDNHLFLLDLSNAGITGVEAETCLDRSAICVNKNSIPYDQQKPMVTSGIRIGTAIVTTRGMRTREMEEIARLMIRVLRAKGDAAVEADVRSHVAELCSRFPFYAHLMGRPCGCSNE